MLFFWDYLILNIYYFCSSKSKYQELLVSVHLFFFLYIVITVLLLDLLINLRIYISFKFSVTSSYLSILFKIFLQVILIFCYIKTENQDYSKAGSIYFSLVFNLLLVKKLWIAMKLLYLLFTFIFILIYYLTS